MALLLIVAIIIIVFIGIMVSMFFISKDFKRYFVENWPTVAINFILVLLGSSIAIVGVYWAFQSESDRIFQDQLDVFKRGFLDIPEEAAGNQALIKSIRII
jgi:hypothetical protein